MKQLTKCQWAYVALPVACFLILLTGWLYLKNEKQGYISLIAQISEENGNCRASDNFRKQELYYNGRELMRTVEIQDTAVLSELKNAAGGDMLALLISEGNCDTCVDAELTNLANRAEQLQGRVLIFIRAKSRRYVSQFRINKKITYPCIHIKHDESSTLDDPPMYFVLEKDSRRINAAFFPQREKPEQTNRYLEKIIDDYFQLQPKR